MTGLDNPQSATLLLYMDGHIPSDRATEFRSDTATKDGTYSVAVSAHDIHEGTYFVSVKANMETAVSFRIVAMLIKSKLELGHKQHGELCPQEWVYVKRRRQ